MFKSFRCEAKVLFKNNLKNKKAASTTEVENLIKQLFHSCFFRYEVAIAIANKRKWLRSPQKCLFYLFVAVFILDRVQSAIWFQLCWIK